MEKKKKETEEISCFDPRSPFYLKPGKLLFPKYKQTPEDRERFWRILCGKEKPDPIRVVPADFEEEDTEEEIDREMPIDDRQFSTNSRGGGGDVRGEEMIEIEETSLDNERLRDTLGVSVDLSNSSGGDVREEMDQDRGKVAETSTNDKLLQEMTDQLRALLNIGQTRTVKESWTAPPPPPPKPMSNNAAGTGALPKTVPIDRSTSKNTGQSSKRFVATEYRHQNQRRRRVASSPGVIAPSSRMVSSSGGSTARVPFTARTPKPPPFLPTFSDPEEDDDDDVVPYDSIATVSTFSPSTADDSPPIWTPEVAAVMPKVASTPAVSFMSTSSTSSQWKPLFVPCYSTPSFTELAGELGASTRSTTAIATDSNAPTMSMTAKPMNPFAEGSSSEISMMRTPSINPFAESSISMLTSPMNTPIYADSMPISPFASASGNSSFARSSISNTFNPNPLTDHPHIAEVTVAAPNPNRSRPNSDGTYIDEQNRLICINENMPRILSNIFDRH